MSCTNRSLTLSVEPAVSFSSGLARCLANFEEPEEAAAAGSAAAVEGDWLSVEPVRHKRRRRRRGCLCCCGVKSGSHQDCLVAIQNAIGCLFGVEDPQGLYAESVNRLHEVYDNLKLLFKFQYDK